MFYCSQKHTPFWSPELYALRYCHLCGPLCVSGAIYCGYTDGCGWSLAQLAFQDCLMLGCLLDGGHGQVLVHLVVQTSRTGARWLPGPGGPGLVPGPSANRLEEGLQRYHCQQQCLCGENRLPKMASKCLCLKVSPSSLLPFRRLTKISKCV